MPFDVDTSIYPKANPNALTDAAGQYLGIANAGQQNQLLQTANQQNHMDLVKGQVSYLTNGFGALLSKPDLSQQDFLSFGQRALQEGIISPQTYQAEEANVQAAGNDPTKLRGLAQQYVARATDAATQFALAAGMPAGSQNDIVTYTGPRGETETNTRQNAVTTMNGGGNPLLGTPAAPTGGNQLTGAGPTAPSVAEPAKPPVPLTRSTGVAAPTPQQLDQFKASAAQQQGDLTNDAGYTANIVPLTKTLDLLPKTPLFGSGSEVPTQVAKVLSTFGFKVGADQAQNASELDKYLTQLARASGAAPNSDSQLAAAFSANPNMTTDRAAAQDVVKTMLALSRMQHAKVAAAQAAGIAPEDYSGFASQFGAGQDPRAYGFDLMTPEAKTALKADLQKDPGAAQKFISSYNMAKQLGIFGQ